MPTDQTLSRPLILVPLLAGLALLAAACSGTATSSSTAATATPVTSSAAATDSQATSDQPSGEVTVTLAGFEFTADDADTSGDVPILTIPVGTTVTFVNDDAAPHTATHGTDGAAAADAAFDLDLGGQGASDSYTFDEAGEFPVTCTLHPPMNLTIVVE